MANQAASEAEDLQLGAGTLYFLRNSDNNKGFHHLGNAEEFTITMDVTTVEKNSSMNRHRELMASVVTAVKPTGTITLDEYNPFNVALGLYGNENAHEQAAATLTDEPYTVNSVPGIIRLKDADGNGYYNVSGISVKPATSTPASATFTGGSNTFTDAAGGTITLSGSYSGTTAKSIYIQITSAATAAGNLTGVEFDWFDGSLASPATHVVLTGTSGTPTGTSEVVALGATGLSLTFAVTASSTDNFTVASAIGGTTPTITCKPASATYKEGKDWVCDEVDRKAGIIRIIKGSSIEKDATVLVSATVPEEKYVTVAAGNANKIDGELLYVGDVTQGNNYVLEGWKVEITPNGDFSGLISDGSDFNNFQLTVTFLSDRENHRDYPYMKLTRVGGADTDTINEVYDPLQ